MDSLSSNDWTSADMLVDGPGSTPDEGLTGLEGRALLRRAIRSAFPGELAVVSSFGAESALLLAWVAEIDPSVPVLFLDTGHHFPQTLAYRDTLSQALGLRDVRVVAASSAALAAADPTAELWHFDPDACCALRKVGPLEQALRPFRAWVTGRKRFQSATRAALQPVETVGGKTKINPLALWNQSRIDAELARLGLPRHPLASQGYRSIGCAPCTRSIGEHEEPRAGRWAGRAKTECGIHQPI